MAVGYLEHDAWLPETMGTIGMGEGSGEFKYAVIKQPSREDIGVGYWHGCVFRIREMGDEVAEDWLSAEDLAKFIRDMEMGRHPKFASITDIYVSDLDGEEDMSDVNDDYRILDLLYFNNEKTDESMQILLERSEEDDDIIDACFQDVQRFWSGVDWSDVEGV